MSTPTTVPTPTPTPTPAWAAKIGIAQAGITTILGAVDPAVAVIESTLFDIAQAAIQAWASASATPVTVAALQGLLADVPLDPPDAPPAAG